MADEEEVLLKSAALKNARTILAVKQRAEEELLRTKDALRESQERLRAALSAAGTGTFRWNLKTNTLEWDGNLDRLFGFPSDEPTQTFDAFMAAVHPADRPAVLRRCQQCAADGVDFDMEFRVLGPNGGIQWISGKAKVFFADGEPLYVTGACAEITRQKATEERLRTAAEERRLLLDSERAARSTAERMSEVKDEFLATLSHELRTPLNAILGWAQVLQKTESASDSKRGLETIERNARVQAQLIDDLLDMSRIISGKLRLDVQYLHPVSFVEEALDSIEPSARAKGVRVERMLDPTAGPISGDPRRLQQVVWNLLTNAIKFTSKSGKVQVLLTRVDSNVEISVADTGIGVAPELLPYLFERFRQGDPSTTRKYGGLGLGLSIVKSLVELHGGAVSARSPGPGKGTTVCVSLPLAVVHRAASEANEQRPEPPWQENGHVVALELAGLKILVVDDQADARELITRVLEDSGASVVAGASADEALALVEKENPDILVSDIGMPDTDGFDLLQRIRALGPDRGGHLPAIALTAFARSQDRTRALRAGFSVHVSKPVDPVELVATVASVARRSHD